MNRIAPLSLLLVCSLCSLSAKAQGIQPILSAIEQHNTQLRAARESNVSVLADLKADNTVGETSVEYTPFRQSGVSGVASSELIVSQEFDFPTLYVARQREASMRGHELDVRYQTLRRDVLLEAQTTCYELLSALQTQQLLSSRIVNADSLLCAYQRRFELGDASLIDLNRIKLDRMVISTELIRNEAAVKSLHLALQKLNGGLPLTDLLSQMDHGALSAHIAAMRTQLAAATPSPSEQPLPVQSLETAAAEASLRASTQGVKVAQQGWAPRLTLGYRRDTELSEASHGILMGLSVPLFSNAKQVRAARLRRSVAEKDLHNVQVEQDAQYNLLCSEATQLGRLLDNYDQQLMAETLRLLLTSVMAGQMSVVDYYTEADRIYELMHERIDIESELCRRLTELSVRFGQ